MFVFVHYITASVDSFSQINNIDFLSNAYLQTVLNTDYITGEFQDKSRMNHNSFISSFGMLLNTDLVRCYWVICISGGSLTLIE